MAVVVELCLVRSSDDFLEAPEPAHWRAAAVPFFKRDGMVHCDLLFVSERRGEDVFPHTTHISHYQVVACTLRALQRALTHAPQNISNSPNSVSKSECTVLTASKCTSTTIRRTLSITIAHRRRGPRQYNSIEEPLTQILLRAELPGSRVRQGSPGFAGVRQVRFPLSFGRWSCPSFLDGGLLSPSCSFRWFF